MKPRPCGTVLVVDHDAHFRSLVAEVLGRAGFDVAEAATGEEALDAAAADEPPSAVVLDVRLPGVSGYEVCHELRERGGPVAILFLSGERTEPLDRVAGLLIGADDYLAKPFVPDELVARLRNLLRRTLAAAPTRVHGLTPRELEVLQLLAEGLSQAEVAEELVISPKTVATHIEHVLGKLGVQSRAQAVALAYREELVETR